MKPTYIQVLIKRECFKLEKSCYFFFCLKVEALIFILVFCIFKYSYRKIYWRPSNFFENHQNLWWWLVTFFKNAGGVKVKLSQ